MMRSGAPYMEEMVKLKKLVIFVLCAIMSFSVVACSKGGTGNNGGGNNVDPPDGDVTQYTITFDVGPDAKAAGVSNPTSRKVNDGGTVSTLPSPTGYIGFAFDGWYEGTTQFTTTTVVTRDWNLTAKWKEDVDDEAETAYYNRIARDWASEAGHFYLHYKRANHIETEEGTVNTGAPNYDAAIDSQEYADRGLWIWPKNQEGRLFNAARIDESGAVYDILLDHEYTDAGWDPNATPPTHKDIHINYADVDYLNGANIGIQLFSIASRLEDGFWSNDGGNVYLNLKFAREINGSYHWFVQQFNVGEGSHHVKLEALPNPYKDDPDRTKNPTKTSGDAKIINSSVDNSGTYPVVRNKAAGYENDGVGYQIFIASFKDSNGDGMGDLGGIIDVLEDGYFDKLNVDVLWLTPFQTSTNYHGYDIKDYFSVDPRFGTLATYRELVYKAHQRGIKVVMDFVLNHTAQSNPWFVKSQKLERDEDKGIDYRNFYSWITASQYEALHNCTPESKKADGHKCEKDHWYKDDYGYYFYSSFSSDMPELNYDYQPVRDAILDVCKYWMAFGLDGFRLDAVKHIYMTNEVKGKGNALSTGNIDDGEGCIDDGLFSTDLKRNLNFYREFNYRLKSAYPNAFLVGENLDGNPRNVTNYYQGLDSQFNFNLYYDAGRAIAAAYNNNNPGDGNAIMTAYLQGAYGNSYTSGGQQVNVKGYYEVNPGFIDGLFTSNHDLPRARDRMNTTKKQNQGEDPYDAYNELNASNIGKTDTLLPVYYAYIMTLPGLNWIYYGDEIGMSGVMQSTIDTGSTSTTESLPHEDRIYRQPMKWKASGNASYAIGYEDFVCELTGMNTTSSIPSVEEQDQDPNSLLNWMRTLTKLRHDYPVLVNGKVTKTANTMNGDTVFYEITNATDKVTVYINFGTQQFSVAGKNVIAKHNVSADGKIGKFGVAVVRG